MRISSILSTVILSIALAACSGVEIKPAEIDSFAAKQYHYYKWRSEPLENTIGSSDPIYVIDPVMRREIDSALQRQGYTLDPARAQFSVDYLYALGLAEGARSEEATNISPIPSVTPNRQVNQAVVDNANALGGLKETSNIVIQFNDMGTREQIWQVVITKIVENVNSVDAARLTDTLIKAVDKALKELPGAASPQS